MAGELVVLGCGTSTGVPMIGCRCPVCTSDEPRNRRTRASVWLNLDGTRVLVDTSTDLRQQALREALPGVDLVLYTHTHADHVHGIDELRAFNFLQRRPIPVYASATAADHLERTFRYIFAPERAWVSAVPLLELHRIAGPIPIGAGEIIPVPIVHGPEQILGFRFGDLAYLTDINSLVEGSVELLTGIRWLVLGALRHEPHPTHFTVEAAIAFARELGEPMTVLTHMSHHLDYHLLARSLPSWAAPAYDGLRLRFRWP